MWKMKNKLQLIIILGLLSACYPSAEEAKEDIHEKYLRQAKTFIQSKIDKSNKDQDVTIERFENLSIDTIVVLSSQSLERVKMLPLWKEYDIEKRYLDKLIEIDSSYDVLESTSTTASRDKCIAYLDSLQNWEDRANTLSKEDTIGYGVQFKYDLKQSNDVSLKDRVFTIYFDKQHDINGDWNK